jgi:hypothetical protein
MHHSGLRSNGVRARSSMAAVIALCRQGSGSDRRRFAQ